MVLTTELGEAGAWLSRLYIVSVVASCSDWRILPR
jgi:hypothetical protein